MTYFNESFFVKSCVTFQSPFIGCKCQILVKRHAKKHERTLMKITSRFNYLSLVANVNFSLNVTRKTTNKLSKKLRHVSTYEQTLINGCKYRLLVKLHAKKNTNKLSQKLRHFHFRINSQKCDMTKLQKPTL